MAAVILALRAALAPWVVASPAGTIGEGTGSFAQSIARPGVALVLFGGTIRLGCVLQQELAKAGGTPLRKGSEDFLDLGLR